MPALLLSLAVFVAPTPIEPTSVPPPPAQEEAPAPAVEPDAPEPETPATDTPATETPETPAPAAETPETPETPAWEDTQTAETQPACPCDPVDWKCMQANAVACEWTASPAPELVPADYELPPRPPSKRPPPRWKPEGPQRSGVIVGAGIGYLGCRTAYVCEKWFDGAFAAEGEVGYRFRFVAPVLVAAGGRGPVDVPPEVEDVEARLSFFDFGVGVIAFPAPRSIFDPYFGLTLGMERAKIRAQDNLGLGVKVDEITTRGSVRFLFGLNFFLSPRVTLGPRFSINVPFAGKWCLESEPDPFDEARCVKIDDLAAEESIDPSDLPRSFAATVLLRLVLPVRPDSGQSR